MFSLFTDNNHKNISDMLIELQRGCRTKSFCITSYPYQKLSITAPLDIIESIFKVVKATLQQFVAVFPAKIGRGQAPPLL